MQHSQKGRNMLESFKKDFWLMSRENRGYYAWANQHRWQLYRAMGRGKRACRMCDDPVDSRELVQTLFDDGLGIHSLFDVTFEALARAETRLCQRFIPQRSNEERLTGHLVSEIEAAINLAAAHFETLALARYGVKQHLDFAYLDLSRGGKYEKLTGGDLGLVVSVDLPDMPRLLSYVAIQAKKLNSSATVDKTQFETLRKNYGNSAAYMFYDMNMSSLAPPMIINASDLWEQSIAKDTDSFSMKSDYVFSNGIPLSLWLMTRLIMGNTGESVPDLESAISAFDRISQNSMMKSDGVDIGISRLAMISIGKPFESRVTNNESYKVTLMS
jgi:hypothetical protein